MVLSDSEPIRCSRSPVALALPEKRLRVAWAFWAIHLCSSHMAAAFGYVADLAD